MELIVVVAILLYGVALFIVCFRRRLRLRLRLLRTLKSVAFYRRHS